ncbi:hypothetical protein WG66_007084, partial [Moniliophthora roreri]
FCASSCQHRGSACGSHPCQHLSGQPEDQLAHFHSLYLYLHDGDCLVRDHEGHGRVQDAHIENWKNLRLQNHRKLFGFFFQCFSVSPSLLLFLSLL